MPRRRQETHQWPYQWQGLTVSPRALEIPQISFANCPCLLKGIADLLMYRSSKVVENSRIPISFLGFEKHYLLLLWECASLSSDWALALCFWNDNNLFLSSHSWARSDPVWPNWNWFCCWTPHWCKLILDPYEIREARQRVQRPQVLGEKLVLGKVF